MFHWNAGPPAWAMPDEVKTLSKIVSVGGAGRPAECVGNADRGQELRFGNAILSLACDFDPTCCQVEAAQNPVSSGSAMQLTPARGYSFGRHAVPGRGR
jgi:hypothetical protein